ncbi:MAG: helix-turn-helix transcriptional regulator [Geovibrio sp.]|nr:helix-turn-helix transcriptional regulator [Geovibrio sp.]
MKLNERIKLVRQKMALNQTQMAEMVGVHLQTLSRYEQGKLNPSADFLIAFAEKTGVSSDWLLIGQGEMSRMIKQEPLNDFVTVPLMSGRISAGIGVSADTSIESCMCFRRDWIRRKGNPDNMSLIRVSGDSMEPTLSNGDIVLIDHSRNYISDFGMYAISVDNSIMIKRLQPYADKVQIISDNPKYPPLTVYAHEVVINGKALWYAHDIGE